MGMVIAMMKTTTPNAITMTEIAVETMSLLKIAPFVNVEILILTAMAVVLHNGKEMVIAMMKTTTPNAITMMEIAVEKMSLLKTAPFVNVVILTLMVMTVVLHNGKGMVTAMMKTIMPNVITMMEIAVETMFLLKTVPFVNAVILTLDIKYRFI